MADNAFLVDRKLGAVPMSQLLEVRAQVRANGVLRPQAPASGEKPILEGGQTLEPDVYYPSANSFLHYYLPRYQVATGEGGKPLVQLLFKPGEGGEVGRLTITFTAAVPAVSRVALFAAWPQTRAMEHVAALTLRFRIGVEGAVAGAPAESVEQSLALQPLQQEGNGTARSTTIFTDKAQFDAAYQAMSNPDRGAVLDIAVSADVSIRTWRQVMVGRPAFKDQAMVLENRQALFTEMLHKETLATMHIDPAVSVARVKVAPPPVEVVQRVEESRAMFVARPGVSVRTLQMRPAATRSSVPAGVGVTRAGVAMARPATMARLDRPMADVSVAAAARLAVANPATVERVTRVPARPAVTGSTAVLRRPGTRPPASPTTLARINTPTLKAAVDVSDLRIAGRKAVPINIALDMDRKPAIIDGEMKNLQSLPFVFPPGRAENADVFSMTGFDSGGIHLLLPLLIVTPDGAQHTVYQDNLMPDVIHVTPSEFRLERDPTAPFLPAICFVASEFSTTDNDSDAEVMFRIAAVYRLEPWLDPDVLELAGAQLAQKGLVARFTPAVPHQASLTLDLDLLQDGQQRKDASVDPIAGVTDTLDLDHLSFLKLWRERLAPERGGGISGKVGFRLFDNSPTEVPVRLSLWESSAELFDVAFGGPIAGQPGRYRILVRNRIESPARISGLPGEVVAGGIAHVVEPQAHIGQLLKPGETRQIDYDVGAEAPPLLSFEPTVIGRAEPDLGALLKLLMVTPGYTALGFSLTVKAAEGVFAQSAPGTEAVTGLLVEFDDGTRANLSQTAMQADVTLVGRLIDQLLGGADDSQRYFYRVTNLHASGEGARTSWLEGHGTTPLQVGTAVVKLDF